MRLAFERVPFFPEFLGLLRVGGDFHDEGSFAGSERVKGVGVGDAQVVHVPHGRPVIEFGGLGVAHDVARFLARGLRGGESVEDAAAMVLDDDENPPATFDLGEQSGGGEVV